MSNNRTAGSEIRFADDVVEFDREYQGVTLWLGDGLPVTVSDDMASIDLLDLIQNPIMRAVTITRLRMIADMLDEPDDA